MQIDDVKDAAALFSRLLLIPSSGIFLTQNYGDTP